MPDLSTCENGILMQSTSTGQSFKVRATATCKTENVIYLIQCNHCQMQYVGETRNPLHIRLNAHRHDIRHKKNDKLVGAHFSGQSHSLQDLKMMVLEFGYNIVNFESSRFSSLFWAFKFDLFQFTVGGLDMSCKDIITRQCFIQK